MDTNGWMNILMLSKMLSHGEFMSRTVGKGEEMKKNNMHRVFAGLLAMIVVMCAAVVGRSALETEQTNAEATADPEPLVINTVQRQDDMLLTVIRDNGEAVFQYEGKVDLWKGADGKAYGIIYLDEEVLQ